MRAAARAFFLWILVIAFSAPASADDWHRWRGPEANGISRETGWFQPWPKEGPRQLWKVNVGQGFSTVSVAKGRVFTAGATNKDETISCFDEKSGKRLWALRHRTTFVPQFYEGGSSGTPIEDRDRIFFLGQMGELFCLEAASGKIIWSNNIALATKTKIPTWGLTGAPLVIGDLLVLNVGHAGTAVEKATGKIVWNSLGEGGYATAVPFQDDVLIFGTKALACVAAKTGSARWRFPWETRYDMNAADPVVVTRERVFISSDYNHGSALLDVKGEQAASVWTNAEMKNPFASSVLLDGFVYGMDAYAGKPNGTLRCIDVNTGALKWSEPSIGNGALIAADGKLIVMSEKAELVIAEATPTRFKQLSRAQVLGGKCWTMPVLSNGKIFCRNSRGDLVCVDPSGK
jgi:outer membrane protein assembly factor BamB